MLNLFIALSCVCISCLLLFLMIYFKHILACKSNYVIEFLFTLLLYKILMYLLFPSIMRMFSWELDSAFGVKPFEILTVYFIEYVSYCYYLIGILLIFKLSKKYNIISKDNITYLSAQTVLVFLCSFYIIFEISRLFDYQYIKWIREGLLFPFYKLIANGGPVIALYLTVVSPLFYNRFVHVLGISASILFFLWAFGTGIRGSILMPSLWVIYLCFRFQTNFRMIGISIAIISMLFFFHGEYKNLRNLRFEGDYSSIEKLKMLTDTIIGFQISNSSLISELEYRFSAPSRASVGFLHLVSKGNYGGFEPINTSLYAPFPRFIFSDKPWPGSVDGYKETSAIYIAHRTITNYNSASEVFTGCQFYWEMDLFGLFGYSIISGMYMGAFCLLFGKYGPAGIPMFYLLCKPWGYNEPKIWLSEITIQIFQYIIPLFLLLFLSKHIIHYLYFQKYHLINHRVYLESKYTK